MNNTHETSNRIIIKTSGMEQVISNMRKKKSRLLVRKGAEHIALKVEEIACIYTENKIVIVVDDAGKKYLCDKNLSELQQDLDEELFFRANRQNIINIHYVRGFKSFQRVKLMVDLKLENGGEYYVTISQETAPQFKRWIAGD